MAVNGPYLREAFLKISAEADPAQFREAQDKASKALSDQTVQVLLGTDKAKADAAKLREQLKATFDKLGGTLKLDTADAQLKFAKLSAAADRLQSKLNSESIDLKGVDKARLQLLGLQAQADRLAKIAIPGAPSAAAASSASGGGQGASGLLGVAAANPEATVAAIGGALLTLPFIAQAVAGAITFALGGALTGVAILGAAKTKEIRTAFGALTSEANHDLKQIGQPFVPVLRTIITGAEGMLSVLTPAFAQAARIIAGPFGQFATVLERAFAQPAVKQSLRDVASAFAAILKALTPALPGLVSGIAQGISKIANDVRANPKAFADFVIFLVNIGNATLQAINGLTKVANFIEQVFIPEIKSQFVDKWATFFVKDLPAFLDIFRDRARLVWDDVEIGVLKFVQSVIGIMAKLPGPLGAPFRKARGDIGGELARIEADVARSAARIDKDWATIHGRKVALTFGLNLPAGVSYPSRPIKGHKARGGGIGATGHYLVGEAGPELVHLPHGAHVMPAHATKKLMGKLAAGTSGWDLSDVFSPGVGTFLGQLNAAAAAAQQAIINSVRKNATLAAGIGGYGSAPAGSGPYQAYARKLLSRFGWGMNQWPPFDAVVNRESGWNPYAQNPTSTAYGIGQFLDTTWATVGARKTSNPYLQIFDMMEYIRQRYGTPAGAWQSELTIGSYDKGGVLSPGWTMAWNGTGKMERVTPKGEPQKIVLEIKTASNPTEYDKFLYNEITKLVRTNGAGNVQLAFGTSG